MLIVEALVYARRSKICEDWGGLTCDVKKMTLCRFVDRLMVEKADVKW